MSNDISLLYTTCADEALTKQMARDAILERYAVCVNIIPGILSYYEWEGQLETNQEFGLLFKTAQPRLDQLIAWIKARHPYATPALLSAEVAASAEFYAYVTANSLDERQ